MSCACVPLSATLPCSITYSFSQSRRVDRRYHDSRSPAAKLFKRCLYCALCTRVHSACSFVKYKYLRVSEDSTGNGYTLTLSAGKLLMSPAQLCHIPIRKLYYKLMRAGSFRRADNVVYRRLRSGISDIVKYGTRDKMRLLRNYGDIFMQRVKGQFPEIMAVLSGSYRRMRRLAIVDFPAPVCPTMPILEPAGASIDTSFITLRLLS